MDSKTPWDHVHAYSRAYGHTYGSHSVVPSSRSTSIAGSPAATPRRAWNGRLPFSQLSRTDSVQSYDLPPPSVSGSELALQLFQELGFSTEAQDVSKEEIDPTVALMEKIFHEDKKLSELRFQQKIREAEASKMAALVRRDTMKNTINAFRETRDLLKLLNDHKDFIISTLQQPWSEDLIPVEAEDQEAFTRLMETAGENAEKFRNFREAVKVTQVFKEPPTIWEEANSSLPDSFASLNRLHVAVSNVKNDISRIIEGISSLSVEAEKDEDGMVTNGHAVVSERSTEGDVSEDVSTLTRDRKDEEKDEKVVRQLIKVWEDETKFN